MWDVVKSSSKLETKLQRRVIGNVRGQDISEDWSIPHARWEARHSLAEQSTRRFAIVHDSIIIDLYLKNITQMENELMLEETGIRSDQKLLPVEKIINKSQRTVLERKTAFKRYFRYS